MAKAALIFTYYIADCGHMTWGGRIGDFWLWMNSSPADRENIDEVS
jgi:hypothetical protein